YEMHEADKELSDMLMDASYASLEAEVGESDARRIYNDAQQRIASLNQQIKDAGGVVASGLRRTGDVAVDVVEEQTKGIFANKSARWVAVAGGVAAAAYAIFNKGYDDTPLTDIPPPPPGRRAMSTSRADLQGISSGKFLNDDYSSTDRETIEMANAPYADSNIPAPTSISQRSYINSATARISNRSLVIDRTNPIEYGRAIQGIIPGAQVGININHNYNMPTDMERKL
ncbi:MAG: hypothetical protein EB127_31460, partial [Alphaproteobacteria bacterium]|nr:hypothetical protein [Alphaproteobacteria bacterium]